MQKKYRFIPVLAISLALAACGSDTKDENQVNDKPVTEENGGSMQDGTNTTDESVESTPQDPTVNSQPTNATGPTDMQQKMDELAYAKFELEVEYENNQEYEIELDTKRDNSIKAKIEDSLNNVEKSGEDAFNELYPLVKQITISQQTDKDEAIKETLEAFNLSADYQKFELEIRFKDGTKLEFKDNK